MAGPEAIAAKAKVLEASHSAEAPKAEAEGGPTRLLLFSVLFVFGFVAEAEERKVIFIIKSHVLEEVSENILCILETEPALAEIEAEVLKASEVSEIKVSAGLRSFETELIIGVSLFRVRQNRIGLAHLLKQLGSLFFGSFILIRMVLERKFLVGLFDLIYGSSFLHSQHFIIISLLFIHGTR